MKKRKSWIAIFCLLVLMVSLMTVIDYTRTMNQSLTPIFAQPVAQDKDGTSYKFQGFLYHFEIENDLLISEPTATISNAEFYLFNMHLQ